MPAFLRTKTCILKNYKFHEKNNVIKAIKSINDIVAIKGIKGIKGIKAINQDQEGFQATRGSRHKEWEPKSTKYTIFAHSF
ncbi:MAG: hypothetical protein LBF22_04120 [Deltaproteobacteria bacterium]|nr:hypothetical protein [Deltaproteobacteria bacterium]